ncbi:MAG: hypothetical protein FJ271_28790 [Planctomycetes bacterium]|nr:hypothetical protein [Planctomycetota bacterium]
MVMRVAMAVMVWALASTSWAQEAPERLLPRGSQVYLRWDGVATHREAFKKTAVGKMLQGDMGRFFTGLGDYLEKLVDAFVAAENPQAADMLKELPRTLSAIGKHGFRLGIEVKNLSPPDIEGMLIFPKSGKTDGGILALVRKAAALAGAEVQETKKGKRTIHSIDTPVVKLVWWSEGDDAVIAVGTRSVDELAKKTNKDCTSNPLYLHLKEFKEFSTWADGFVDVAGLAKVAGAAGPDVARLVDDLGLKGLKSITFHSGFDGPAEHSVLLFDMPGPRKGLLKLANQRKINLADLPPMPADLSYFAASNLDLVTLYDGVLVAVEGAVRLFAPEQANMVKQGLQAVEGAVGVKLRDDLLGSLGDLMVSYRSPADGPLGLGAVYLIKMKNQKKFADSLDSLIKAAATVPFVEVSTRKNAYRGADIHGVYFGVGGASFHVFDYTMHKGWLGLSFYPQPLQGYVLRTAGDLPAWKPSAALARRLQEFPKEFVGISVSDPRPSLKLVLSLAPTLVSFLNSMTTFVAPGTQFDVNLIPNAHEATRHLFPNITVITDDGKRVRVETKSSLPLPF